MTPRHLLPFKERFLLFEESMAIASGPETSSGWGDGSGRQDCGIDSGSDMGRPLHGEEDFLHFWVYEPYISNAMESPQGWGYDES